MVFQGSPGKEINQNANNIASGSLLKKERNCGRNPKNSAFLPLTASQ